MSEVNLTRAQEVLENQEKVFTKNRAYVAGIIEEELQYSHEMNNRKFYKTKLEVKRDSGVDDHIPILISDTLKESLSEIFQKGKFAEVDGKIRVYKRRKSNTGKNMYLYVYAEKIKIYDSPVSLGCNNFIYLNGYVGRTAVLNKKLSGRTIADNLLIEVKRDQNGYDFIPCIAWNRGAKYVASLSLEDSIEIEGRLQSRMYFDKKTELYRETYEVSIQKVIKD